MSNKHTFQVYHGLGNVRYGPTGVDLSKFIVTPRGIDRPAERSVPSIKGWLMRGLRVDPQTSDITINVIVSRATEGFYWELMPVQNSRMWRWYVENALQRGWPLAMVPFVHPKDLGVQMNMDDGEGPSAEVNENFVEEVNAPEEANEGETVGTIVDEMEREDFDNERVEEGGSSDDETDINPAEWASEDFSGLVVSEEDSVRWEYKENEVIQGAIYTRAEEMKEAVKHFVVSLHREFWVAKSNRSQYEVRYPGSSYAVKKFPSIEHPGKSVLQRVFLALHACKMAFVHCCPVLYIDGTFLTGKYRGHILTAIGVDGNNQVLPLAFAFVESENTDSWYWFLKLVKTEVVGMRPNVCLIHDRHAGMLRAIEELQFGSMDRGYPGEWEDVQTGPSTAVIDHPQALGPLPTDSPTLVRRTGVEIRKFSQWILHEPKEKWAKAYDTGGSRYGIMTTNFAEVYNWVMRGVRGLPLVGIVEFILHGTCRGIYRKRVKQGCVLKADGTCHCSCAKPKLLHGPCTHVIAAASECGIPDAVYVSQYFSKQTIYHTWSGEIYGFGIAGEFTETNDEVINIPDPSKLQGKAGRRKTRHIHNDIDESEAGRVKRCSKCDERGHTYKHCPKDKEKPSAAEAGLSGSVADGARPTGSASQAAASTSHSAQFWQYTGTSSQAVGTSSQGPPLDNARTSSDYGVASTLLFSMSDFDFASVSTEDVIGPSQLGGAPPVQTQDQSPSTPAPDTHATRAVPPNRFTYSQDHVRAQARRTKRGRGAGQGQ
uniref:Transposon protein, putative, Mutator sub-class n=2 Tax=Oryza sativa subsp. japonica TaxID=39947 RepID=Q8LMU6_ORYSJ|nr:Putative mutator-like transposase [Oryza sativa Japonica Group]ABB46622.2 transposon protein, putative, Mutator sub-class [Oryza sativa Japonica Group]